ncbi:Sulfatase-modifying factor enzyme 1 [Entomobacter blattae]|uniref:Sulfatase-modifying factor enzyme 1 n=2 Tax=Entomobacter blattae TaxID=2762277 RepID=A0A7H1NQC3_9PROT|nr:Sulfatase-modifying factor enzyme 1 [Entomobacter blattae]
MAFGVSLQLAISFSASSWGATSSITWDKKFYDPHPMEDDLTLPLPCGGAMVFRPIDVPQAGGLLGDQNIQIGRADFSQGYNLYLRQAWLAAPFPGNTPSIKRYYLAKYDVTQNQYNALLAAQNQKTCPEPSLAGRVPVSRLSWFDAQSISAFWSGWLLEHAKNSLPKRGDAYGYLRLPTEEEWSYAAKGGMKVSPTEFMAPLWPMPDGVEHYIMAGSLAENHLQPVGQLKSNPLGLYDMLGEVEQMMQEPYRLNRVGRQQGQAGGLIGRGGNYTYDPHDLFTAMREEIAPFNATTHSPTALSTLGFRMAIGAVSLGSLQETEQAQKEFMALTHSAQADLESGTDPTQLIDHLQKQTTDLAIQQGLDKIKSAFVSKERANQDAAARTLRAQAEAAATLGMNIWQSLNTIRLLQKEMQVLTHLTEEQKKIITTNVNTHKRLVRGSIEGYTELAQQIATAPLSAQNCQEQFQILKSIFETRGQNNLAVFLSALRNHIELLGHHASLSSSAIEQSIGVIPADKAR